MNKLEKRILRLIPIGADNPRAGKYIAELLDLDIRTIRDNINRLIVRYGIPIVAKRGLVSGYYIPANDTERLEGIRELRAQHNTEGKRLDSLIGASLTEWREYLKDEPIEPRNRNGLKDGSTSNRRELPGSAWKNTAESHRASKC